VNSLILEILLDLFSLEILMLNTLKEFIVKTSDLFLLLTLRVIETLILFTDRIIIVSEDVEKEAPPLIIRNKLSRKEGPAVKAPKHPLW
jgi:hypothetical protein